MTRLQSNATPSLQTLEEASEWFVQFRLGDDSAPHREEFSAWLCRSPEHIRAYLQIAQTYADVPALKGIAQFDLKEVIAQGRGDANVIRLGGSPSRPPESSAMTQGTRKLPRKPLRALAATAALAVVGLAAYLATHATGGNTYATAVGEQRSIALPDGSTFMLNANSRVRVRLSSTERRIDLLAGQALFQVAKDKDRPFVVYSERTIIRAVGTAFDVYRRKSGTTVTVIEGRVAVAPHVADGRRRHYGRGSQAAREHVQGAGAAAPDDYPPDATPTPRHGSSTAEGAPRPPFISGQEVYLSAGEQMTVGPDFIVAPQQVKAGAAVAWTQRQLVFDGTSLPEALAEFNRYNNQSLILSGDGLDDLRVSGVYSSTDPATLVRFLQVEFGLKITKQADKIVISRN